MCRLDPGFMSRQWQLKNHVLVRAICHLHIYLHFNTWQLVARHGYTRKLKVILHARIRQNMIVN